MPCHTPPDRSGRSDYMATANKTNPRTRKNQPWCPHRQRRGSRQCREQPLNAQAACRERSQENKKASTRADEVRLRKYQPAEPTVQKAVMCMFQRRGYRLENSTHQWQRRRESCHRPTHAHHMHTLSVAACLCLCRSRSDTRHANTPGAAATGAGATTRTVLCRGYQRAHMSDANVPNGCRATGARRQKDLPVAGGARGTQA